MDDPFSINQPYASMNGTYSVLAHGPNEEGDLHLYSRNTLNKNSMDAKFNPHELANIIKSDPQYHEGQTVALFACNAGKWAENSYAQSLSNELGAKVIAPTENIVGVSFGPKDDNHFKEWLIAKKIEEVKAISVLGKELYMPSYDKVYTDSEGQYAGGKSHYIKTTEPGEFTSFSPTNEIKTDKAKQPQINDEKAKEQILPLDFHGQNTDITNELIILRAANEIAQLPESQRKTSYEQLAEIANSKGMLVDSNTQVKPEANLSPS